ncbi:MAG: hypothetical protein HY875_11835 [Chloroflexi bacterium]|nr:hypothetical protein [Chloroflexota bacterium]
MPRVSVEIDAATLHRLLQEAEARDVTVETLLAEVAAEHAGRADPSRAPAMARAHLQRFPELFPKLAE